MIVERNANGAWMITSVVRHAPNATNTIGGNDAWYWTRTYYGYTRRIATQLHRAALTDSQLVEVDE